jgi:hypothetical protein
MPCLQQASVVLPATSHWFIASGFFHEHRTSRFSG